MHKCNIHNSNMFGSNFENIDPTSQKQKIFLTAPMFFKLRLSIFFPIKLYLYTKSEKCGKL